MMCPHCGEQLERITATSVWMCPICDYGETDELRQQRMDEEDGELNHGGPEPDPTEAREVNGLRNIVEGHRRRPFHLADFVTEVFNTDQPLLTIPTYTHENVPPNTAYLVTN